MQAANEAKAAGGVRRHRRSHAGCARALSPVTARGAARCMNREVWRQSPRANELEKATVVYDAIAASADFKLEHGARLAARPRMIMNRLPSPALRMTSLEKPD